MGMLSGGATHFNRPGTYASWSRASPTVRVYPDWHRGTGILPVAPA